MHASSNSPVRRPSAPFKAFIYDCLIRDARSWRPCPNQASYLGCYRRSADSSLVAGGMPINDSRRAAAHHLWASHGPPTSRNLTALGDVIRHGHLPTQPGAFDKSSGPSLPFPPLSAIQCAISLLIPSEDLRASNRKCKCICCLSRRGVSPLLLLAKLAAYHRNHGHATDTNLALALRLEAGCPPFTLTIQTVLTGALPVPPRPPRPPFAPFPALITVIDRALGSMATDTASDGSAAAHPPSFPAAPPADHVHPSIQSIHINAAARASASGVPPVLTGAHDGDGGNSTARNLFGRKAACLIWATL